MAEEITLVLVWIDSFQYPPLRLAIDGDLLAIRVKQGLPAAVMAGCDHVGSHPFGGLQEGVELDFPVAEHIGIRGPAGRILIEHVVDDPLAIFLRKVYEVEGDTDLARNHFCHEAVFLPFAVPVKCGIRIVPVLHKHGEDIVALLLEKQGDDAGVDSSGKTYANLHNSRKFTHSLKLVQFFANFENTTINNAVHEANKARDQLH